MTTRNYWTVTYDQGNKIDHVIELEQIDPTTWRVVLDDEEFIMPSTTLSSDFWGLVREALVFVEARE